jgi:uncharacterized protein
MTELNPTFNEPVAGSLRSSGVVPAAVAAGAVALLAIYLFAAIGGRQTALLLVGLGAGVVLYHAAFGFTSAWRVFIADGRGAGLRAQMLMLAATCIVFFPLLAVGQVVGQTLRGSLAPLSVSVVIGAFMFGIGMQLGGGCASGTLYPVGGGSTRMVVTLLFFIAGSVAATAHVAWWNGLPAIPPASLLQWYGPIAALAITFAMLGAIAVLTMMVERRRHGRFVNGGTPVPFGEAQGRRWLYGPWPLVAGALGLAVVNIATLLIAGRPWGVTGAFALWGAKALDSVGVPIAAWPYWSAPSQAAALQRSVFLDVTTVMNVGIIFGALLASALAGRFAPVWRASWRSIAAAVIGGLLLGYGARIAYGCNIGAYFSGIASGSLHGWLWMVAAFAGNAVGVYLRPFCDLPVERTTIRRGTC